MRLQRLMKEKDLANHERGTGRSSRPKDSACESAKLRGRTATRSEWATSGSASENDVTTRVTRRERRRLSSRALDGAPVRHAQRRDEDVLQFGQPLHGQSLGRERMPPAQDLNEVLDEERLRSQVPFLEDLGDDGDPALVAKERTDIRRHRSDR
jgi:hypothetical protein